MSGKPVVKGLLLAGSSLLCFAVIGSLLYTYGPIPTHTLPSFSRWLLFIALLFGATAGSKTAGSRGLFYGLSVTFSFMLILTLIGLLLRIPGVISSALLFKFLLAFIAGIIGGIVGIGLSEND